MPFKLVLKHEWEKSSQAKGPASEKTLRHQKKVHVAEVDSEEDS